MLLGLSILAMLFIQAWHFSPTERAMLWPDAIGLFTAGNTQLALAASMPAIVAVLMGTITAVFGGVLRDILYNELLLASALLATVLRGLALVFDWRLPQWSAG